MIQELLHLIFEGIVILLVTVKEFNYRKMWGKPECFIAILFFLVVVEKKKKKKKEREKRNEKVQSYKIRERKKYFVQKRILSPPLIIIAVR